MMQLPTEFLFIYCKAGIYIGMLWYLNKKLLEEEQEVQVLCLLEMDSQYFKEYSHVSCFSPHTLITLINQYISLYYIFSIQFYKHKYRTYM